MNETSIWWVLGTLITGVLGGTGISAWVKARGDVKKGVREQDVSEENAESERWIKMIDTQAKALVEPLRIELADLRSRFNALELDLAASRRKYWVAVAHIRILRALLQRAGIEVPPVAPQIEEDV